MSPRPRKWLLNCAVLDEVVDAVNRTEGDAHGIQLELFKWEWDAVPQIGPGKQAVLREQSTPCHVYLGIISATFGEGQTKSEFDDALAKYRDTGGPWIMFYFDDDTRSGRSRDAARQWLEVCEFRERIEHLGIVGTYKGARGVDSFYEKVSEHLRKIVQRLFAAQEGSQHAKPAGTNQIDMLTPPVPAEYIQWLRGRCCDVELMCLNLKHGSGVRLNHVYTPLATSAQTADDDRDALSKLLGPEERDSVQLLLELLGRQSLYVSGAPGSGKTTFCRWSAFLACNGELPAVDIPAPDKYREAFPQSLRDRLPMFIRLCNFWQYLPTRGVNSVDMGGILLALENWLGDQTCPGLVWDCLKAHLDQGSTLLMLDGIDEVPQVHTTDGAEWFPRQMLISGLGKAVARWTEAGNRVLVTSRSYGLDDEQQRKLGLTHAPILNLDPPLQALLVGRWLVRLQENIDLGLQMADALIDHIRVERGLDDLATNPLLLTAMCIIYAEGERLPHDKYTLYDKIVDTVLHNRYAEKDRTDLMRGRLAAVALGMHTGRALGQHRETPEAAATEREIDLLLAEHQNTDGSTDKDLRDTVRVREDLLSQSVLLVSREDGVSFFHPSIQEFLAAERLFVLNRGRQNEVVQLFLDRGKSADWRNTLSFHFGCVVTAFKAHAGLDYLRRLANSIELPSLDASQRFQQHPAWNQAIVLGDALQMLAGREAAIPDDLTSFFQRCVLRAIEQEIAVKERQTLEVALGRLGDPRIVTDLRVGTDPAMHPGYQKIPAGDYLVGEKKKRLTIREPFWLSKYPVTNSQYAKFINAGGYTNQQYWSYAGWKWRIAVGVILPEFWRTAAFNSPNQPVVGVSWWEAEAFCCWAGGFLPSEQQWEAAARGPEGFEYPWGNTWEDGICNNKQTGLGGTSVVGVFPRSRSPLGLEDMAGNVWEWCTDLWETWPTRLAFRGGCWGDDARSCWAADRNGARPQYLSESLGFRVAAVPLSRSSQEPAAEPGA